MHLFYWDFLEDLEELKQRLKGGSVIAGETDTIIGLFAQCSHDTFKKLNEIKGRSNKPYIFLVSDIKKAKKLVDSACYELLDTVGAIVWPGQVTVIMKANNDEYSYAAASDGTIAIRVPDNQKIRVFLDDFDALFSTSANKHQEPTPQLLEYIDPELLKYIDALVVFKERQAAQRSSTIIRVDKNNITVIRGMLCSKIAEALKRAGFVFVIPMVQEG